MKSQIKYIAEKRKKLSDQSSHTIHYGHIYDENEIVDEVLVMLMKGPHSYTGGRYCGNKLSWRRLCGEKNFRDFDQIRGKTCGAGRIYKTGIFERKIRFYPRQKLSEILLHLKMNMH